MKNLTWNQILIMIVTIINYYNSLTVTDLYIDKTKSSRKYCVSIYRHLKKSTILYFYGVSLVNTNFNKNI